MTWLTDIRNKVLATGVRYMASPGTIQTHQDSVLQVPSRDPDRTIKVHIYNSKHASPDQPSPVLINFHGSGFVIPMHGSDDDFALQIATSTAYTVLDVQYRLAPEHPFPSGLHDAEDVVRHVLSQPQSYDPTRIAISGFSAGGNFALILSGHVFPPSTFRHLIAFYPVTDLATDPRSKSAPDPSGASIPPWIADAFNSCYLPAGVDRAQPLVSPTYIAAGEEKFPDSVLVVTCAQDNLAPEAEALVGRMGGKGVRCERVEGCGHAWDKSCKPGTAGAEAKDRAYGWAVEVLSG